MKPAPFRYYRASSVEEALDLLNGPAAGGKLLAGGQSLVPLMNLRLARPEAIVDLNRIAALSYIRPEGGEIAIGALTRHRELEFSPLVRAELPILAEAVPQIGHPAIRNRGTVGGSVAHADPAAELPCVFSALDARIVVAGTGGRRTIAARDFFVGFYETALAEGEIVEEVRVPVRPRPKGWSFLEFARRHGDFALAEASALLYPDDSGARCAAARVVVGGGAVDKPFAPASVENLLQDEFNSNLKMDSIASLLKRAGELAEAEIRARGAAREDGAYLFRLAATLVSRSLGAAIRRWQGS
ncbi:MAG TPA: xanthine dehydrogenase family protein subunit M [Candidatus Acidoferrales bacterium]|nr:xanthine dehydrogenase family protein subunit M [Candidatus Acidoferrales bacterium]